MRRRGAAAVTLAGMKMNRGAPAPTCCGPLLTHLPRSVHAGRAAVQGSRPRRSPCAGLGTTGQRCASQYTLLTIRHTHTQQQQRKTHAHTHRDNQASKQPTDQPSNQTKQATRTNQQASKQIETDTNKTKQTLLWAGAGGVEHVRLACFPFSKPLPAGEALCFALHPRTVRVKRCGPWVSAGSWRYMEVPFRYPSGMKEFVQNTLNSGWIPVVNPNSQPVSKMPKWVPLLFPTTRTRKFGRVWGPLASSLMHGLFLP